MKITLIRKEETVVAQRTVKLETVLENMKTETKTCPVSALRRTLKFSGGSGHVTAGGQTAPYPFFGGTGQE